MIDYLFCSSFKNTKMLFYYFTLIIYFILFARDSVHFALDIYAYDAMIYEIVNTSKR